MKPRTRRWQSFLARPHSRWIQNLGSTGRSADRSTARWKTHRLPDLSGSIAPSFGVAGSSIWEVARGRVVPSKRRFFAFGRPASSVARIVGPHPVVGRLHEAPGPPSIGPAREVVGASVLQGCPAFAQHLQHALPTSGSMTRDLTTRKMGSPDGYAWLRWLIPSFSFGGRLRHGWDRRRRRQK